MPWSSLFCPRPYRNSRIRMSATEDLLKIDEELYSRQLYVLGHEAMQKMATATVLVSGMTGLGVEIAKNVILAGVKSVTLHDQDDAQWRDLSSQFYLSENNVGQNRAKVSQEHLSKLNDNVEVIPHTSELTENFLATFKVVVLTNSSLKEQLDISDFCHANQICFVLANTKGLAGYVFCDFGENFVVYDPSEADPASAAIKHITLGNPGLLTVAHDDEQGHFFMDGDWVMFSEIEGMTQLNGSKPRQICVKGKNTLEIGDTSSFSPYQHGGIITQVKMPQKHSYVAIYFFPFPFPSQIFSSTPVIIPWQEDADMLVELVRIPAMDQEQENLIRTFAYGCMGDLSPMNSFIGGLAAQEVLKAVSGKFTPLDQWLYFDAYECLPEGDQLTEKNCAPCDSRYDGQIAVFGADFQKRLGKQKYFLVGAGAIGCELLKNFAMIGLAAGEGGEITVTDMDIIEKSNLNRQFLFRPQDVSKQKSEVAAAAVRRMNPNINVIAQKNQVGPDTEHFYGDDFFLGLDGVVSALDNFQARNHVGERCVHYLKPLLDSGTDGTMGNALVFVPYLTKTHGHIQDGDGRDFPLCTLRYFPSNIQHTIQWARNQFEDLFKRRAEDTNKFLRDPTFFEKEGMETWEMLNQMKMSLKEQPHCWRDCVAWARKLWERLFCHDILQLLYNYPPEHVRREHILFTLNYFLASCPDKDSHLEFITHAANLRAENYDISPVDKFQAKRIVGRIVPAIVTTTAAVAGLTCLELYKLVWQHKDLGSYRHSSFQLSDPFLSRAQAVPSPQAYKVRKLYGSLFVRKSKIRTSKRKLQRNSRTSGCLKGWGKGLL
uniref:Ubiquitin like modifier activating enzyme 7 n=1 Tax=Pseudonaja textilis TaxID=8673 RepID=A0A670Z9D8_PSETE